MATLNLIEPKGRLRSGQGLVKKLEKTSNTLGPFATRVLHQIKLAMEVEPSIYANPRTEFPNEAWVQWFMRQYNCARVVALNRAYAKLENQVFHHGIATFSNVSLDLGLKVLGVIRLEDYFYTTRSSLEREHQKCLREE